jgi:hypothetical protein
LDPHRFNDPIWRICGRLVAAEKPTGTNRMTQMGDRQGRNLQFRHHSVKFFLALLR